MDELTAELAALRGEISALRQVLAALLPLLAPQLESPASGVPNTPGDPPAAPPAPPATPTTTLLARRNAQRLNDEVLRRTAAGLDPEGDTEVDLLIDRLHDLVDPL
ncbi:hypothetical protein [Cyanobium sp. ATX 6F1]|uniref:hypothetical protein n=1 Tax=unclassified Cyanobium TaxID=2627006 RepID=UPI0020CC0E0D|nr:hypothetical protein [Cyanobium sp. ATX 6F1]MCP9915421.1 hypothetical protein [Cyanobium sp. ATX 6F1]